MNLSFSILGRRIDVSNSGPVEPAVKPIAPAQVCATRCPHKPPSFCVRYPAAAHLVRQKFVEEELDFEQTVKAVFDAMPILYAGKPLPSHQEVFQYAKLQISRLARRRRELSEARR